ncbi:MAG: two-component system response regulator [Nitrospinaceae bacterium]|nr:MAG: two-component system response regulator [Nitrospinaceae bacterium]
MVRILVIDDENNIRLLYKEEFQDEGYEVLVAASAEEGLEKIRNNKPDIVTLDIKMPGEDGIELMRKLKEEESDIPVVLCTAYGGFKRDFRVWASDAYVVKSADLTELKNVVRQILGKKYRDLTPA